MARNKLFIYYLFLSMVTISYSQRDKKKFRKDYTYIEATESFYKFHTIYRKWQDAKDMCEMEGSTLFIPEDQAEVDAVIQFWNETQHNIPRVSIGVSSWIAKGVFETIDGRSISDVYSKWEAGEPNDANGNEDCVQMRSDTKLNDFNCDDKNPFLCKKTLSTLEWDEPCDMANLGYVFNDFLGKCYKFHLEPKTWTEAYVNCNAEQSYLAIIDSQSEADYLTQMTTEALQGNIQDNSMQGAVHLGFHKRRGVWSTTRGTKLERSGYSKWGNQQPDGGDNETCGAMFCDGLLQDVKCDLESYFICEHDVARLANSFNDRFGTD